jgi:hypothetical protein
MPSISHRKPFLECSESFKLAQRLGVSAYIEICEGSDRTYRCVADLATAADSESLVDDAKGFSSMKQAYLGNPLTDIEVMVQCDE